MRPTPEQISRWAWSVSLVSIALILGGIGGFFARPILEGTDPPRRIARSALPAGLPATPIANPVPGFILTAVNRTRQWKGNPNAPVTIVEFGDFQ